MNYFDPPDKTQSVLAVFPSHIQFIGDVRRRLFAHVDCEWNGVVRDITAQMERPGMLVNSDLVCVQLAEFYRQRAHWAKLQLLLGDKTKQKEEQ
jgi:hypothetical protein